MSCHTAALSLPSSIHHPPINPRRGERVTVAKSSLARPRHLRLRRGAAERMISAVTLKSICGTRLRLRRGAAATLRRAHAVH